jgi:hypothetical protein
MNRRGILRFVAARSGESGPRKSRGHDAQNDSVGRHIYFGLFSRTPPR